MKDLIRSSLNKAFFVAFILSPLSQGQNWTDEEQGLLDAIEADWDAWMEGVKKKDPKVWLENGLVDKDMTYWWSEHGAPNGLRTILRDWDAISETDIGWVDFRPVSIRIHDNVGVVHFYGYWKAKTKDGAVTTEHKRTEVFIKKKGKWVFIAGHSSPSSSKDSDPYK